MWDPELESALQAGLTSPLGRLTAATRGKLPTGGVWGRLTEVGLFVPARQNSIKVTAEQTGIRTHAWISAAEHIQETFSPNEWAIEREHRVENCP